MIQKIVKDPLFLQEKSQEASFADLSVGQDLLDTLSHHRKACVGMAANMIGVKKRIIIINMGLLDLLMFNPKLKSKQGPYQTEEGCLSLSGSRPTTRYQEIVVTYRDTSWKEREMKLTGFQAQICQHELDHLDGILI